MEWTGRRRELVTDLLSRYETNPRAYLGRLSAEDAEQLAEGLLMGVVEGGAHAVLPEDLWLFVEDALRRAHRAWAARARRMSQSKTLARIVVRNECLRRSLQAQSLAAFCRSPEGQSAVTRAVRRSRALEDVARDAIRALQLDP